MYWNSASVQKVAGYWGTPKRSLKCSFCPYSQRYLWWTVTQPGASTEGSSRTDRVFPWAPAMRNIYSPPKNWTNWTNKLSPIIHVPPRTESFSFNLGVQMRTSLSVWELGNKLKRKRYLFFWWVRIKNPPYLLAFILESMRDMQTCFQLFAQSKGCFLHPVFTYVQE